MRRQEIVHALTAVGRRLDAAARFFVEGLFEGR
jgi:hypothetical protein